MKKIKLLLIIIFILNLSPMGYASSEWLDPRYDEYDSYALVEVLINEGRYELAQTFLNQLSSQEKENKSSLNFWQGVIFFYQKNFPLALRHLKAYPFTKNPVMDQKRQLFRARSFHAINKIEDCLNTYTLVIETPQSSESDFISFSECLIKKRELSQLFSILLKGQNRFRSLKLLNHSTQTFLNMGLGHWAAEWALEQLAKDSQQASDFVTISEIFLKAQQTEDALKILELGRTKYIQSHEIELSLVSLYFQKNWLLSVDEAFLRASLVKPEYNYHLAELNRQLGRFERSQFFNLSIQDKTKRLKQKIATLVDQNRFGQIASLEPQIQRSELIEQDEIRYALAYSLVQAGEWNRPIEYVTTIQSKDLIEKAIQLRKTLEDCRDKGQSCFL